MLGYARYMLVQPSLQRLLPFLYFLVLMQLVLCKSYRIYESSRKEES